MKKKKFPEQVFVCYHEEGTENEFLAVTKDVDETVYIGERKAVAIYTLKELKIVEGKAIIK